MRKFLFIVLILILPWALLYAGTWEKQGDYYYLAKNNRDNFSHIGAGPNVFASKYLNYDGVDFLVRGVDNWKDYGRLDLEGNNIFVLPIKPGIRVREIHLLAGGNYGNSYEHDAAMRLYGDKYFYATLSIIFVYTDGVYKELSVPVFWDWFHLGLGSWSKSGAKIKSLGENPVRKNCNMFHVIFTNPRPNELIQSILLTDSWIDDRPFSDVFALTLRSSDMLEAIEKKDR